MMSIVNYLAALTSLLVAATLLYFHQAYGAMGWIVATVYFLEKGSQYASR
jgi:hypothetical protein